MIPKALKDFRFIKTSRKIAIEKGYPIEPIRFTKNPDGSYFDQILNHEYIMRDGKPYKSEMHSYDFKEMNDFLKAKDDDDPDGVTYGVLCGHGGLVVVDVDDRAIADILLNSPEFANTFIAMSAGKKLPHFYFLCEEYQHSTFFDQKKPNKRVIDIKAMSGYVIGPNSFYFERSYKREYTIYNDAPIQKLSFESLMKILESLIDPERYYRKKQNPYTKRIYTTNDVEARIFKKISCDRILADHGVDISTNPGDTPFAVSEKKKCLSRTGHLWFDHHTQEGGTVITLYAKLNEIDETEALYQLSERAGVKKEDIKKSIDYYRQQKPDDLTEFLTMRFMGETPCFTLRSVGVTPEVFIYKEGIYVNHGQTYIMEFCNDYLGKFYTKVLANKIIDKVIVRSFIHMTEFFEEHDLELVPVNNGLLNVFTRELHEFTPEKIFFNKLPVTYDPKAKCEITIKHLQKVLNGDNDVRTMQEIYGSLLYRKYKFEKAFIFYGRGRNGKGKTMDQMKALIGSENSANISLEDLGKRPFMLSHLNRKLAILAGEIGNAKLDDTKMFKMLTGQDILTADVKFKDPITFKNYAKAIFAANDIPESCDDSDGFWARWIMLGFTKRFIPEKEYKKLEASGDLKTNFRIMDPDMNNKLEDPKELSGVLNWALDGLARLFENNGYSNTDSIEEIRMIWRRKASSVVAFITDHLERSYNVEDDWIDSEELYDIYIKYCQLHDLKTEDTRKFKKMMTDEKFSSKRTKIGGINGYKWTGVKTKGYDYAKSRFTTEYVQDDDNEPLDNNESIFESNSEGEKA
jgi:P4 family phage/plasmid primase-like protien